MITEQEYIPPTPEISSHILIGLNAITRHLETLSRNKRPESQKLKPETIPTDDGGKLEAESTKVNEPIHPGSQHLAAVFVCRLSQPSVLYAHLPQLIATASLALPHLPATRLVQLPQGCESRLCSSLGLHRASFVAIKEDAPYSKPLIGLVREIVPVIEVPWLKEAQSAQYKPVKINAISSTALVMKPD